MRRGLLIAGLIATAVVVVVAVGVPPRGHGPARPQLPFAVGFNESFAQTHRPASRTAWLRLIDADARLHRAAGSTVLRTPLRWDAVQPAPDRLDFDVFDTLVGRYGAAGVRLLFVVDGVPRWARGRLAAWSRFIDVVARRYARRIVGLDVFNEPNLPRSWIAPAAYRRVLCAAHAAAAGRVRIGGGVLAGGAGLEPYLRSLLRAGAGRCMDALSFHPYPDSPDVMSASSLFQRTLRTVRGLRDRYAPSLPLWVTETGWRAATRPQEPLQARVLLRILRALQRRPDGVRLLLFHTLIADPVAPGGPDYGVVALEPGGVLRERAAYPALARAIRG